MDQQVFKARSEVWKEALSLSGCPSLMESGVRELADYFHKDPTEVRAILPRSTQLFTEEWHKRSVDAGNHAAVVDFYNTTEFEMFELMDWHVNRVGDGPLNYVAALEMANHFGFKNYLDYGSGIGSGAILFLKHGFAVECADIADPLMGFARYRLQRRDFTVNFIDLKIERPQKDRYDIITCFDVLEHAVNPLEILTQLRNALKAGGILVTNNVDGCKDESRPMHISTMRLSHRLRSLGFNRRWDWEKEFEKSCDNSSVVLQKVTRPSAYNAVYYLYDKFYPKYLAGRIRGPIRANQG